MSKKNKGKINNKKIENMKKTSVEKKYAPIFYSTLFTILSIILILLKVFVSYKEINGGDINKFIYSIYHFITLLIGDFYNPLILIMVVYVIFNSFFSEYKFLFLKKSKIFYSFVFLAMIIYNSSVYKICQISPQNSIGVIIREILVKKAGTGILGLPTIIFYKFSKYKYYYLILYILISILGVLFLMNIFKILMRAFIQYLKYINSKEYKMKKQKLKLEKQVKIEKERQKTDKYASNISDYFINKAEKKLEMDKETLEYILKDKVKVEKEEIKEETKNIIESTQEYVQEPIQEHVKDSIQDIIIEKEDEIYIEDQEIIEDPKVEIVKDINLTKEEENEKIKEALDKIFVHKTMDEDKKREMMSIIEQNIIDLEEFFKTFKIDAKVENYLIGPTITRYELTIPKSVRVKNIVNLSDDIALNLAVSKNAIRIEAPIPGKSAIGIEIPNSIKEPVYFSNMITSKNLDEKILPVVVGKNVIGEDKILDIVKMPHLLIAGTTGSGKSVFINALISTLITKKSPDEVKFIMIDPKVVELSAYNDIPHLLLPTISDPNKASVALKWAVNEMEERYKILANLGLKNISQVKNLKDINMPYIVIVIDELADLMMVVSSSVETSIARIAQKARAVGIHLVVATQRPSTDVITGIIKANFPSRISFTLRSIVDSRTILDQTGSEKLLGNGDMLLLENGSSKLERIQGAFISDDEIFEITSVLKENSNVEYDYSILEEPEEQFEDPVYIEVLNYLESYDGDKISISKLQQEFKIGFNRASRLVSELKKNSYLDENNYILR